MEPVVGLLDIHLLTVRLVVGAGQGDVFIGSTDAAGKFLWRVLRAQHEDEAGCRRVGSTHGVVGYDAMFLYQADEYGTHAALRGRCLRFALHHLFNISRRQVDGIAPTQVLGLNGGQHGVSPTELALALVLDRCHGVQHFVGIVLWRLLCTTDNSKEEYAAKELSH